LIYVTAVGLPPDGSSMERLLHAVNIDSMARNLKEEHEKWGLAINLEKIKLYGRRKRNFKS